MFKDILQNGQLIDVINYFTEAFDNYHLKEKDDQNMWFYARKCVDYNRLDIMQILLDTYYYNVCENDASILKYCIVNGSVEMFLLLNSYRSYSKNTINDNKLLIYAYQNYNPDMVKILLDNCSNVNLDDALIQTMRGIKVIKIEFNKKFANINIPKYHQILLQLINAGCDVNYQNGLALKIAIACDDYESAKILLDNGANINNFNQEKSDVNTMYSLLINYGIDPQALYIFKQNKK